MADTFHGTTATGKDIEVVSYEYFQQRAVDFGINDKLGFSLNRSNALRLVRSMIRGLPLDEKTKEVMREELDGNPTPQSSCGGSRDFYGEDLKLTNGLGKLCVGTYPDGDTLLIVGDNAFEGKNLRNGDKREDMILDKANTLKLVTRLNKHVNKTGCD